MCTGTQKQPNLPTTMVTSPGTTDLTIDLKVALWFTLTCSTNVSEILPKNLTKAIYKKLMPASYVT
jgi:hypothetical protein